MAYSANAETNYKNLFDGFYATIGEKVPAYLYYPRSGVYKNAEAMNSLTSTFQKMVDNDLYFHFIDAAESPYWNAPNWTVEDANSSPANIGIFVDGVHYNGNMQTWFAQKQWEILFGK